MDAVIYLLDYTKIGMPHAHKLQSRQAQQHHVYATEARESMQFDSLILTITVIVTDLPARFYQESIPLVTSIYMP